MELATRPAELSEVLVGIDENTYQKSRRVRASSLSDFLRSPRLWWLRHMAPYLPNCPTWPESPTPSMVLGSALHCMLLEPEQFANRYIVRPHRNAERRLWNVYHEGLDAGRQSITAEQFAAVKWMASSVGLHDTAQELLCRPGRSELAVFWQTSGVACRGKVDRLLDDGTVIDIKTCTDCSPWSFTRTVAYSNYHLQAGMYLFAAAAALDLSPDDLPFYFVAVENRPPFDVAVYQLDLATRRHALDRVQSLLTELRSVSDRYGTYPWPSRYTGEIEIGLPKWAMEVGGSDDRQSTTTEYVVSDEEWGTQLETALAKALQERGVE